VLKLPSGATGGPLTADRDLTFRWNYKLCFQPDQTIGWFRLFLPEGRENTRPGWRVVPERFYQQVKDVFSNNNPSAYTIQAASIDTLFKGQKSNITISNIKFTGAAKAGVVINGVSGIVYKNLDATLCGEEGLSTWFCTNVTVDNCTSDYSLGSGISIRSSSSGDVNTIVKNCTVTNTSLIAGMETSHLANTNNGILVRGGSKIQVLNNVVKNSGYIGIEWYGDNVSINITWWMASVP
jgi:hypothetical protein